MELPEPEPGLVISYSYLWRREQRQGQEEGRKDRPCVVVLAVQREQGRTVVSVAPITHSAPVAGQDAVELPPRLKAQIGLDAERSWVVTDEVNSFDWPGYDVRPARGRSGVAYGVIPSRLFDQITARLRENAKAQRLTFVRRD